MALKRCPVCSSQIDEGDATVFLQTIGEQVCNSCGVQEALAIMDKMQERGIKGKLK